MSKLYQLRLRPRPVEEGVAPEEMAVLLGDSPALPAPPAQPQKKRPTPAPPVAN